MRSYIKRYMGAPSGVDVEALKAENEQLKQRVKELETQVAEQKVREAGRGREGGALRLTVPWCVPAQEELEQG